MSSLACGVRDGGTDWAGVSALRFVEAADAFSAACGVDDVLAVAFADGLVGALGLAGAAGDAIIGNLVSHFVLL